MVNGGRHEPLAPAIFDLQPRDGSGLGSDEIVLRGFRNERQRGYIVLGAPALPRSLSLECLGRRGFVVSSPSPWDQSGGNYPIALGDLGNDGAMDFALGRTGRDEPLEAIVVFGKGPTRPARFLCGDCNGDGSSSGVLDALTILTQAFIGGVVFPCRAACDVDANGAVAGIPDAISLLSANFLGTFTIPPPHPACGELTAPADQALGCESSPAACR